MGRGYDRRSLGALATLGVIYAGVFLLWGELIDWSRGMDWLLVGIWALMTALLAWKIDLRRDLPLVLVAAAGGLVIEWWGTTTQLWAYFTQERPPPWILPAWPVAALAVDRLARLLDRVLPRGSEGLYWLAVPTFVAAMTRWLWPTIGIATSQLVVVLMIGVTLTRRQPRWEWLLFLSGAGLGVLLEYWGTSRHCWTYYTREVPPWEAVVAHGFASIAFARGVQLLQAVALRLRPRSPAPA